MRFPVEQEPFVNAASRSRRQKLERKAAAPAQSAEGASSRRGRPKRGRKVLPHVLGISSDTAPIDPAVAQPVVQELLEDGAEDGHGPGLSKLWSACRCKDMESSFIPADEGQPLER